MARRKTPEDHKNLERWLLTYADMITLMMAFFIMLYTMSRVDTSKLKEVSASIRSQTGYIPSNIAVGGSMLTFDGSPDINAARPFQLSAIPTPISDATIAAHFKRVMKQIEAEDKVLIRRKKNGLVLSITGDDVLFDRGGAVLKPASKLMLDTIGTMLSAIENKVSIEGHTDENPNPDPKQMNVNWKLSSDRALAVLQYFLTTQQIPEPQVHVAGWASNAPITDEKVGEQDRRKFARRVDIVVEGKNVTRKAAPEMAPSRLDTSDWSGNPNVIPIQRTREEREASPSSRQERPNRR